ncbi:hypothetical protein ACWFRF_09620 [Nocardia sp. NPDC055165]
MGDNVFDGYLSGSSRKLKKFIAATCLAIAATATFASTAHAAPAPGFDPSALTSSPVQAAPIALTPEQRAYCQNITTNGLIGMGLGAIGGFVAGSAIGAFPGAIIGGVVGGSTGSSAPMPDADASGQPPVVKCFSGGAF